MRTGRILHPQLAGELAKVGHGDIVLVTDAGFPIPAGANRIDLAVAPGLIDVRDVLRILRGELFLEGAHFATELKTHYPSFYTQIQEIFTGSGVDFYGTTHEDLCEDFANRAKLVIRSGSFEPWANFALIAATEPFAWFTEEQGAEVLPTYIERRRRMNANETPDLAL